MGVASATRIGLALCAIYVERGKGSVMSRPRPAVRIIFAPLARRGKKSGPQDLRHTHGLSQDRTIWLDPRLGEVAKTLYHELLHVWHPSWPEEKVMAEEELRWNRMTWKRKANLYRMLGSAKLEGEE